MHPTLTIAARHRAGPSSLLSTFHAPPTLPTLLRPVASVPHSVASVSHSVARVTRLVAGF